LSDRHVAIVGGGYSGTLQAIHLLRRGARVTLIERADRLGRGIAYSTRYEDHLLNVPAGRMSAFADQPGHFADWLSARAGGQPTDFAQRRLYGAYLREVLDEAKQAFGERLRIVEGEAEDVRPGTTGEVVHLVCDEEINADAVILALGNLEPDLPRNLPPELRTGGLYIADPWATDISHGLQPEDRILLIGTGLTAVDAAVMLDSAGFKGRTLAVSRRGLLPRPHADPPGHAHGLEALPEQRGSRLIRFVRREAERIGWRAAVDQLRPVTHQLWAEASVEERRRFLRHLRPWWDVHRHRIAASIADRVERMQREGRLVVDAGKIISMTASDGRAQVEWRPRGSSDVERLEVARIVNCTGPQMDISRAGETLLDGLIDNGRIRPDPCRIGIDVDRDWRVLGRSGEPAFALFAIGPMTRSAVWEMVAVPDIRNQVQALAARVAL
jgi:uncharacterized NAD(P)/FAD-binding protein YdhS